MNNPEYITPKRVKWSRRVGTISTGLPGIPAGEGYYKGYQKSCGKSNSGGVGRRASRFYAGRFQSKPSVKTSKK